MNTKLKLIHYFNVYHQIKYALLIILTQYQSVVSHHHHTGFTLRIRIVGERKYLAAKIAIPVQRRAPD